MSPTLTSALSDFTKQSEYSKSGLAAELSSEPPLHLSELSWIKRAGLRLGKLVPFAFVRFLMIFFIATSCSGEAPAGAGGGASQPRCGDQLAIISLAAPP